MKDKFEFIQTQNALIRDISTRGELLLKVIKMILDLLSGNLNLQEKITRNYSKFNSKIKKIDVCLKKGLLQISDQYSLQVQDKNAKLLKLITRFKNLKNSISGKFSQAIHDIMAKKSEINKYRIELFKIINSKDDFIINRFIYSHKSKIESTELNFQQELITLTHQVIELDSQIILEFNKILTEFGKNITLELSNWNPLKDFNFETVKIALESIPVIKENVSEQVAFLNKSFTKILLFTINGNDVYAFNVIQGNDSKIDGKWNSRQELQCLLESPKINYSWYESTRSIFK